VRLIERTLFWEAQIWSCSFSVAVDFIPEETLLLKSPSTTTRSRYCFKMALFMPVSANKRGRS
jgi:hypothetical protein